MSEYFIYYTESNLVCVIIFIIMLSHDLLNVDRQEKQIKYDHALVTFILYFISDAVWAAIVAGVLPSNRFTVGASNFANYLLMAAITYRWLDYVMAVEQTPNRNKPGHRFSVVLPFIISTIALITVYITAPDLLFTANLEIRTLYNVFLVAVPYIYIAAIIFYSMRRAVREENPLEKRNHIYIGLFPLMVVGGGFIQMAFLPDTPIFCFSCTILMLIFYIQSMEGLISMDPLTRLNNRGQLIRYVSQESNIRRENRPTYVVMLDVNGFKGINDTFGHAEGDKALKIIADSLRAVVRSCKMPVFLGRYGGDEFILVANPKDTEEMDQLISDIRETIRTGCSANGTPYIISISAGYDRLLDKPDTIQKCMQRADNQLYKDKEENKRQGRTTKYA